DVVDRFVRLLNAADLPGLLAMMLDTGSVEMPPSLLEVHRAEFERTGSWFWHAVNVHPELPPDRRPPKYVNERALFQGEPLMLSFVPAPDGRRLAAVTRFEERDGRLARVRCYQFTPETVAEVAAVLGLATQPMPYRFA